MGDYKELDNGKNSFVNRNNISSTIDAIIDDKNPNLCGFVVFEDVKLNNLSKILNDNNVVFDNTLPLVMTKNHIYMDVRNSGILNIGNYHNLGKKLFVEALNNIDNPTAILNDKGSTVITVGIKDNHNNDIIVPIRLNERIRNTTIEANIIQSIYGKRNFESYLRNKLENVIYNKKSSTALSNSSLGASSISNIANPNENVNITSKPRQTNN